MGIEMIAKVRRFIVGKAGISPITVRATGTESLSVSQVESDGTDLTRSGRRFMLGSSAAVTGIAPVAAQATTQPQWAIWNNDLSRAYVFEHLGVFLSSGSLTAGNGILVDVCLFTTPSITGSSTAGMTVSSCSNGGPSSRAIVRSSPSAITTPAAPNWYNIAKSDTNNTVAFTLGAANYDIRGRIIVPPQQGLGIVVYCTGSTPLFVPFAMWSEIELDLE